jgi:hypothetical protein
MHSALTTRSTKQKSAPMLARLEAPGGVCCGAAVWNFDQLIPWAKRIGALECGLAALITASFGWTLGETLLSKIWLNCSRSRLRGAGADVHAVFWCGSLNPLEAAVEDRTD